MEKGLIQRTCRICLDLTHKLNVNFVKLQSLADGVDGLTYQDVLWEFSGFAVQPFEPQQLCVNCAAVLVKAYEMKLRCEETQRRLETEIFRNDDLTTQVKVEVIEDNEDLTRVPLLKQNNKNFVKDESNYSEPEFTNDDSFPYDEDDEETDDTKITLQSSAERKHQKNFGKFLCDYCNASYKLRPTLRKHYESQHADKKTHECQFCDGLFFTPSMVDYHMKRCRKRKRTPEERAEMAKKYRYVCPICGKLASTAHIKSHLEPKLKKDVNGEAVREVFVCDICGTKVGSRSTLIAHMKFQHLDHKLKCKHCDQLFRTPSVLASHVRKFHTNQSQIFKCKKCDFIATNDTNLRRHRMSHSGKKMHQCHICNHEFLKRCRLMIHMASHSDQRPFACDICGAAFKTTKAVQVHKKTHTEHDYECPVCQKTYLTNQLMRIHVQKNHPEYELPPPGTVFSKSARKRMAEQMMREMAIRSGIQKGLDEIVLAEPPPIEEAMFFQPH